MLYFLYWPHRLTARTNPSQGLNRSPTLREVTIEIWFKKSYTLTMKKILPIIILILIITSLTMVWQLKNRKKIEVANFEECARLGNPIMESYPRQCRFNEKTFTENIGNELEKNNLIRITTPRPNDVIKSPLEITGEARGVWFFEANFPIVLTDWDGLIIAESYATAQSEWMTKEFVPFKATLIFKNPQYKNNGTLILKKDNPSGLPEHDDALEIPILFDNTI